MRLVYEAIPPVNPVTTLALAALFALCALIVAIGMVKLVDAISRAFFGTVSGAVGWIPGAGGLLKHSIHKIEQKISHMLGTAERKLDAGVAMTWNNCAHLVAWVGAEIESGAKTAWHLAQQAKAFIRHRDMSHAIRTSTKPLKATDAQLTREAHLRRAQQEALTHTVATGVMPRIKTAEWEIEHVLEPSIAGLRARTKALENGGTRLWRWLRTHPKTIATGAFVGAVAFALTKLGGGWIRCANWRKIGRTVCRLPAPFVDALLAALVAVIVLENLRTIAQFAEGVTEEFGRDIARLVGVGDFPSDRFTIE